VASAALTWRQVVARRLARSRLLEPAPHDGLVDVVRETALIQAQVLSAAETGLAVRVRDATAADVRRDLYERRTLVKTWSIRGTLHLVPADELGLWAAAARGPKPVEIDPALRDAVLDALDGRSATRGELAEAVGEDALRSPWGAHLAALAWLGLVCFGDPSGGRPTFVRVDQWLGSFPPDVDPYEARLEVLRRYLRAYGPAKPGDFARWSGFGREAASLFEALELDEVRVDRTRAWLLAGDDADFDRDPAGVQLLPQYDAYVIGFRPREQLIPPVVKEWLTNDPKGKHESATGMRTVVVDGIVSGFWRRNGEAIEIEEVVRVQRARRQELAAAVERVLAASN
jgi:hypothetical protein